MLPKLDVVTVNHSLGAFLGSVVIIADEIDDLNDVAISTHQASSIVRHRRDDPFSPVPRVRHRASRARWTPSGRSK
jgi:hypothetical protein